tara:strand:- start:398 stop:1357 length:960 start_codon:yes stop_codon:yes gene_type:complete
MINYLYCFDTNYNIQALCSIYSLLQNSSEKINLEIIHNKPESFKKIYKKIINHSNLNNLNLYEFKNPGIKFPNLNGAHVSEATYYRIFISKYIPKDIDSLVYLDADIICYRDPSKEIDKTIKNLLNSNEVISVKTEHKNEGNNQEMFKRLSLEGDSYFNAGVMLIDFKKWNKLGLTELILEKMKELEESIIFWDQDVLNSYFDGRYIELNNNLNYNLFLTEKNSKIKTSKESENEMILLHYSGSYKPWTVRGAYNLSSDFYHQIYRELFQQKYHIISNWRVGSLIQLIKGVLNLNIFFINKPLGFLIDSLKIIFKKNDR